MIEPNHIYSTGNNKYGQIGQGDLKSRSKFTLIKSMIGKNVIDICAGGNHSFFILDFQ